MRYRKKPVVIEAMQVPPYDEPYTEEFMEFTMSGKTPVSFIGDVIIETLEGMMTARPGDWLIKGVQGEMYPCKPDIFEETYEAVEE